MESPEEIERALERLVPRAMSESGAAGLDALIDELAGEEVRGTRWGWISIFGVGAAAALVGLLQLVEPTIEELPGSVWRSERAADGVRLVAESEGVVAVDEAGSFVADSDGALHQAWHVQVLNEERFHDDETGSEVRVYHPREEVVLMPVTAF